MGCHGHDTTTPERPLHDFCKEATSRHLSVQPSSSNLSVFTLSPPSSTCTSDSHLRAIRNLSMMSPMECRRLSPYARLDLREGLEMGFAEKVLTGEAGLNIGHNGANVV